MDHLDLFGRLTLAFGIGLVIGVERGWQTRALSSGQRAAGVRTFALTGLLGGVLGAAGQIVGDAVVAVGLLGFFGLVTVVYFTGLGRVEDRGTTTEIAALLTFALGLMAVRGDMAVAAAAAVLIVAVLDIKEPLHRWITRIEDAELTAAIKLLVISVVVLPVLPDQGYGPGGVINPYEMWWIVVIIASISFIAYTIMRVLDPRAGIIVTGLLGGVASSTAATVSFARLAARTPQLATAFCAGIAFAITVMFIRTLVIVTVLDAQTGRVLLLPLLLAALGALGAGSYLLRYGTKTLASEGAPLGPPSDIGTAVRFGAALVVIALAIHYGKIFFGESGALIGAMAGGLVDVDATTITMARLAQSEQASLSHAIGAILAALVVNNAAKAVYAVVIGGRGLVWPMALIFAVPFALGGAGYFLGQNP